jgi:gluconolactonase
VFAELQQREGEPAGLCLDQHGNLYVAHDGVGAIEVFSRKGRFIRHYPAGLVAARNVAFGGPRMDQLFITGALGEDGKAPGALFRLPVPNERGLPPLPREMR